MHLNDKKGDEELKNNSMIFITEGDSASGSITKSRDVQTLRQFSALEVNHLIVLVILRRLFMKMKNLIYCNTH